MATVIADMTMSLDGFIADPNDGVEQLFGWYDNGPVTIPTADPGLTFHTSEVSAARLHEMLASAGALIGGRRIFNITNGWGGHHPMGVPAFIVTHSIPDGWPRDGDALTFVTDGVASAVAQAKAVAGDKVVAVASANIAQQCLDLGLLDGVSVNLIPVLLGQGIRFFDHLKTAPIQLEDPEVIEGTGVTHLYFRVKAR